MLDISVHKQFTKDLQKAKLNPTNSEKMFAYISLIIEEKEFFSFPLSKSMPLS